MSMDEKAKDILRDHVESHRDGGDPFLVHITWKCKTLQNYKYMLITTLQDNKFYELTYDGNNDVWYLDEYEKISNTTITSIMAPSTSWRK